MKKRLFLAVLVAGATVFALGASVRQIEANAGNCVDYKCGTAGGVADCTHISGGPKCDVCSPYDNLCALNP
jgi:hypothetical protein